MKNYKNFEGVYLGITDIARFTIITNVDSEFIHVGADGDHWARIIEEPIEIPKNYKKTGEIFGHWIWIFDDDQKRIDKYWGTLKKIEIYRAGSYGIIIYITEAKK